MGVGCPLNSVHTDFRLFFLLPSIPYSVRNRLKFRRNSAELKIWRIYWYVYDNMKSAQEEHQLPGDRSGCRLGGAHNQAPGELSEAWERPFCRISLISILGGIWNLESGTFSYVRNSVCKCIRNSGECRVNFTVKIPRNITEFREIPYVFPKIPYSAGSKNSTSVDTLDGWLSRRIGGTARPTCSGFEFRHSLKNYKKRHMQRSG